MKTPDLLEESLLPRTVNKGRSRWIRTLKTMVSSSPSPPPDLQPQQQIDLIDLTGVMVTTIELVIGYIKLETEFAPKSDSFGDGLNELESLSNPIWRSFWRSQEVVVLGLFWLRYQMGFLPLCGTSQ
jgi:hypothetical protein